MPAASTVKADARADQMISIFAKRDFYESFLIGASLSEPERAPHKWCIESKSLHSDGTAYVRTYVTLIVSAMVSSYTRLLSYL